MVARHRALHQKEQFPPFARGKVFGKNIISLNLFLSKKKNMYFILKHIIMNI